MKSTRPKKSEVTLAQIALLIQKNAEASNKIADDLSADLNKQKEFFASEISKQGARTDKRIDELAEIVQKQGRTLTGTIKDQGAELHETVDNLATITKKHLEKIDVRIEETNSNVLESSLKVSSLETRIASTVKDVSSLDETIVRREEHEDLEARVKVVERKLHLVSGR